MAVNIKSVQQFSEIIGNREAVAVKFFADWCPDCKRMDFFIDNVLKRFETFTFYELDKDQFPSLVEQYEVMGIPSIIIFQNGEKIGHLHSANARSPEEVTEFLADYFN